MRPTIATILFIAGLMHFGILIASALVPLRLNWKRDLAALPRLHRQLFWVYGGYIVLSIVALGTISVLNAETLASGSLLARSVCAYIAVFWGIRLSLQTVLDARPFLTTWWLKAGYHTLTLVFASLTVVYGAAAIFS
ncbi:MAG: hypothetical protein U0793_11630 [Gemmataceae bacterium]